MIKNKVQTFNDGVVEIGKIDASGEMEQITQKFQFGEKTVGAKRFFAAKSVNVEITKFIAIPYNTMVEAADVALIGQKRYEIVQIQFAKHNFPPETLLSLKEE